MKQKLLKSLLAIALLCTGVGNVWADDAYFGASTKVCGAWDASSKSKTYAVPKGTSATFNFKFTTNTDNENYPEWEKWYTWLIDVSCGNWMFAFRGDNEDGSIWVADGMTKPTPTYSSNFETMYTRDNMDGANVVLQVSRSNDNVVTILATTTKGSNTWTKQAVFTLLESAGDNDLTFYFTADNGYGEISSVIGQKYVGTKENVTSWWNNFSEYYTIEANKTLTLNFKNYSSKTNNWNNFVTVIANDKDRGAVGYAEQVVIRTDNYGWGTNYNNTNFSNNYNWTSYKNDLDGADVELKIRRSGTKVAIKATYTTTGGSKYYQQYVYTGVSDSETFRAFLTVDQSHISDLTSSVANTPAGAAEYLYTVKAIDDADNDLKTFATGSYWTGEDAVNVIYPYAIKSGDDWYTTLEATYGTTISSSNTNVSVTYAKDESIVGFYEGEDASGTNTTYSNGAYGTVAAQNKRDRGIAAGTLAPGIYQFVGRLVADGATVRSITIREGANDPMASLSSNNTTKIVSADFTVSSTTGALYINGANSGTEKTNLSTSFDYVLIRQTAVTGTIPSSGFGSLASAYGLDFSSATVSSGTLTAYVVSDITKDRAKLTSVTEMPANSGVILEGTSGATYSIPVKSDATFAGTNKLQAAVTATAVAADAAYILKSGEFCLVTAASTVPAGKAYLLKDDVPSGAKAMRFVFDGDEDGIEAIENGQKAMDNDEIYNLAGQRVNKAQKGVFIVNGKKVVVK